MAQNNLGNGSNAQNIRCIMNNLMRDRKTSEIRIFGVKSKIRNGKFLICLRTVYTLERFYRDLYKSTALVSHINTSLFWRRLTCATKWHRTISSIAAHVQRVAEATKKFFAFYLTHSATAVGHQGHVHVIKITSFVDRQ